MCCANKFNLKNKFLTCLFMKKSKKIKKRMFDVNFRIGYFTIKIWYVL